MGSFAGVELEDIVLTGERLLLRPWEPADADRVLAIMADRSMFTFLALPDPYTAEAAAEFVTSIGHERRTSGTGLCGAMVERGSGRLVGSATLRLTGDAEIGYWIAPDARGHGYAAETTRMLSDWGFGLGVRRIRLLCAVDNLASVRTAMSAGYAFEGVSRGASVSTGEDAATAGRRADHARFARLPTDDGAPVPSAFAALPGDGLSDGVLGLRPVRPDDGNALFDAEEDALSVHWGFTGRARPVQEWRRIARQSGLDALVGRVARLAMIDLATGDVAGCLDVRLAGPPQVAGIGYAVRPAFRGRGYTTRALRLLVPWAFDVAGFARLELGAKAANVASQRAAAAAGFAPDGVNAARLRNGDGTFADEVRFALVNPRYR